MRDHSPLKYVTVDVNLCNFCPKLDVYSVNFMVAFQILSPPSTWRCAMLWTNGFISVVLIE